MCYVVQHATYQDYEKITQFLSTFQCNPRTWIYQVIEYLWEGKLVILYIQNKIVGFLIYEVEEKRMIVSSVLTHPDFSDIALMSYLLSYLQKWSKENGYRLYLRGNPSQATLMWIASRLKIEIIQGSNLATQFCCCCCSSSSSSFW